jgi:hypothetical protein
MGNYTSMTKEEWVKEKIAIIKHKFGDSKFKDEYSNPIEWDEIEEYLGALYKYQYGKLDIEKYRKLINPKVDPLELDIYI